MRIATYTRISTDEELQPYSLEAQATRLDAYAESQGDWQIVRRFTDQASGAILERDGLERALREAKPAASTCCSSTGSTDYRGPSGASPRSSPASTRRRSSSTRPPSPSTPPPRPVG
jgi:Resolvase, N terminal domain